MTRHLWLLLRLLLTAALFVWLFHDGKLRALQMPAEPAWLLPAWLCAGINELAGTVRWWLCLRLAGVAVPFRRAAALYFLGLFTSLFLPGLVGGDAVKIALLALQFPERKMGGIVAVLMDRLSGFVVVSLWITLVGTLRGEWFQQTPTTAALAHSVFRIFSIGGGGLLLWFTVSRTHFMQRRIRRFPFRKYIVHFESGFDAFIADRPRALAVLTLGGVCHACYFLLTYFTARAFASGLSLVDAFSIVPIIDAVTMLPITLSGLGLREQSFAALLTPLCGIAAPTAVAISLLGFALGATWALGGMPIFLRARGDEASARDVGR